MSPRQRQKLLETYLPLMLAQQENEDTETAHSNADAYLCELLLELGFKDLVDAYNKVEKWYA